MRHILIPFVGATRADATVAKTDAEAKKTADSIYNVLKGNRSKYKSLLVLSSDKVSNEKDGEIEFAMKAANALGASIAIGQELLFQEQIMLLKIFPIPQKQLEL